MLKIVVVVGHRSWKNDERVMENQGICFWESFGNPDKIDYICLIEFRPVLREHLPQLTFPANREGDNALGSVRLSVRPFVCAFTLEPFDLRAIGVPFRFQMSHWKRLNGDYVSLLS